MKRKHSSNSFGNDHAKKKQRMMQKPTSFKGKQQKKKSEKSKVHRTALQSTKHTDNGHFSFQQGKKIVNSDIAASDKGNPTDSLSQSKKQSKMHVEKKEQHEVKKEKILQEKKLINAGQECKTKNVKGTKKSLLDHSNKKSQEKGKGSRVSSDESTAGISKDSSKLPKEYSSNWKQFCLARGISSKKKHKNSKEKGNSTLTEKANTEDKKSTDVWFDDVDEILLEDESGGTDSKSTSKRSERSLVKLGSYSGCTKVVAMDCEMVGVGEHGTDNMLARVSVVNQYGNCVYDTFVKPVEEVVDYRTHVSGVRKEDLDKGKEFKVVQKEVAEILNGRVLVGHALHNDLQVLYLSHPKKKIRDTSRFKPFRQLFNGKNPSLKKLSAKVLHVDVQKGEHSSVQDAQAAMRLYTMYKKQWEKDKGRMTQRSKPKITQKSETKQKGKTKLGQRQSVSLLEDSE